jgi:hypothetical protein
MRWYCATLPWYLALCKHVHTPYRLYTSITILDAGVAGCIVQIAGKKRGEIVVRVRVSFFLAFLFSGGDSPSVVFRRLAVVGALGTDLATAKRTMERHCRLKLCGKSTPIKRTHRRRKSESSELAEESLERIRMF